MAESRAANRQEARALYAECERLRVSLGLTRTEVSRLAGWSRTCYCKCLTESQGQGGNATKAREFLGVLRQFRDDPAAEADGARSEG